MSFGSVVVYLARYGNHRKTRLDYSEYGGKVRRPFGLTSRGRVFRWLVAIQSNVTQAVHVQSETCADVYLDTDSHAALRTRRVDNISLFQKLWKLWSPLEFTMDDAQTASLDIWPI